jgi:hypothetical protein
MRLFRVGDLVKFKTSYIAREFSRISSLPVVAWLKQTHKVIKIDFGSPILECPCHLRLNTKRPGEWCTYSESLDLVERISSPCSCNWTHCRQKARTI